jgi:hypothetical protein
MNPVFSLNAVPEVLLVVRIFSKVDALFVEL